MDLICILFFTRNVAFTRSKHPGHSNRSLKTTAREIVEDQRKAVNLSKN